MAELTPIGEILDRKISQLPEASEHRLIITADEAERRGIASKFPPPEPDVCCFCGKILYREGIMIQNTVWFWKPIPERCNCEQAQAYWQEQDAIKQAEEKAAAEARKKEDFCRRVQVLLGNSGIKARFQQRTFDRFVTDTAGRKQAFDIAKRYSDNFDEHRRRGEGLYIEGTNGTGKTHLAAAIALDLLHKGTPVICKTANDLLGDIKKAFDNAEVKEHEILAVYKNVDLLVIDDLGKEQCSDWSISTLYNIINDRYEDMRPTIITTNYNAEGLINALTPRGYDNTKATAIISRLREMNKVITMAWKDYRGG